ncbi:MAG: hypothetical protein JWO32_316 [Bacteroidetes bacterium]|nr:hypothetical protein [Bacteroidota bacterium]
MAGLIKKNFPQCTVIFLGRTYTKDVIALSKHVDEFVNYDEIEKSEKKQQKTIIKKYNADVIVHVFPKKEIAFLAKSSGISKRVGTTNRLYHWFTCNKLIFLSRKKSSLHESQLNLKLLKFLNIQTSFSIDEIGSFYGFTKIPILPSPLNSLINTGKFNLILHPKSKGSAKEWGLENFGTLINVLPAEKYTIFISGTAEDGKQMQDFLHSFPQVINLTGKLSLQQFIAFISQCDALVAASTGPLHIAAALNKKAIGLFSPKKPIHPGRWMPLGKKAHYLVFDKACEKCADKQNCDCISKINPMHVVNLLEQDETI